MSHNEAPFEIVFPAESSAVPEVAVVAVPAGDTTVSHPRVPLPLSEPAPGGRTERWLKVLHISLAVLLFISVVALAGMMLYHEGGRKPGTNNASLVNLPTKTPNTPEERPEKVVPTGTQPDRTEPKPDPAPATKTEPKSDAAGAGAQMEPLPAPEPKIEPKTEPPPAPAMGNGHSDAPAPDPGPSAEDLQVQALLDEGGALSKTDPRQAIEKYARVIELRPARTELWKNIADLHLAADQHDEASAAYRTLLKHHPTRTDALNNLGALALQAGRLEEAARCMAAVVETAPSANSYYNFGNLHLRGDDLDRAAAAYRRALEYDAKHERARFNLGLVLERQGRLAEAASQFGLLMPAVPDAARERLRIEAMMGGAEAKRALETARASSEMPLVMAVAGGFRRAGELEKALALLDRAVELTPQDPLALTNRGAARHQMGRGDEAIEDYEAALRADAQFADAHFNLGVIREERGLLVKALEHYTAAIAARPKMASAHNNVGALYLKVSQPARALECFRRAVDADPRFPTARLNMAWAYLALDSKERALEELKAYVALVPKDQRDPAAVTTIEKLEGKQ